MVSRILSLTSFERASRSLSAVYNLSLMSLRSNNYSNKVSRLHSTYFTNNSSPGYKSHNRFGFTIRESEESLEKLSPVVVILGWNSSQTKHLLKYSEIFEKRGFGTVCLTASPFNTFFRSGSKVKKTGYQLLDLLLDMNCSSRPVFLYAFSSGGGAVFYHLTEALTTSQSKYYGKIQIAGSIFDSFPVAPKMKSVKAVQRTVTGYIGNPVIRGLVWYSLRISVPLLIVFNPTVKIFMDKLLTSPLKFDQLIFFSKTDPFAPYEDIEDYIKERKMRGVHVVSKCWEKSDHVNHFREHKEEYLSLIHNFVNNCIKKL